MKNRFSVCDKLMKRIIISIFTFVTCAFNATPTSDFKAAYAQSNNELNYVDFLLHAANDRSRSPDDRLAACDELFSSKDLTPFDALDVLFSALYCNEEIMEDLFSQSGEASYAIAQILLKWSNQSLSLPLPVCWISDATKLCRNIALKITPNTTYDDAMKMIKSAGFGDLKQTEEEVRNFDEEYLSRTKVPKLQKNWENCDSLCRAQKPTVYHQRFM